MLRVTITCLFLLLSAAILTTAFVVGIDTPQGSILINLGTEVGGIVLTVAIVDWLFETRETRRAQRHQTVSSLGLQVRAAINARDTVYPWALDDWANERRELEERLKRRRRALKIDEMEAVRDALAQSGKTLEVAREFFTRRKTAMGWRQMIDAGIDRRNDELVDITKLLDAHILAPGSAEKIAQIRTELRRIAPTLSSTAATLIQQQLDSADLDVPTLAAAIRQEPDIHTYTWSMFARFEREVTRERNGNPADPQMIKRYEAVRDKAISEMTEANIPSLLVSFASAYMTTQLASIAVRGTYDNEVQRLAEMSNRAVRNILDETPFD